MNHVRDPLLLLSVILAVLGALQASQGMLTPLIERYPVAFGLTMTVISCVTAGLTVYRNSLADRIDRTPLERAAADHTGTDEVQ